MFIYMCVSSGPNADTVHAPRPVAVHMHHHQQPPGPAHGTAPRYVCGLNIPTPALTHETPYLTSPLYSRAFTWHLLQGYGNGPRSRHTGLSPPAPCTAPQPAPSA
eukprot:scaffold7334_cov64-Phaeocystis_antarctica.AAC.7